MAVPVMVPPGGPMAAPSILKLAEPESGVKAPAWLLPVKARLLVME